MTDDAQTRFGPRSARRLAATALATEAVLAIGSTACAGTTRGSGATTPAASPSPVSPTTDPYSCAPNGPAGSQTIYGTFGDAGVIGWTGNTQAVVACLGSFFVDTSPADGGPGSASTAAVTGTSYGYGVRPGREDNRT